MPNTPARRRQLMVTAAYTIDWDGRFASTSRRITSWTSADFLIIGGLGHEVANGTAVFRAAGHGETAMSEAGLNIISFLSAYCRERRRPSGHPAKAHQ